MDIPSSIRTFLWHDTSDSRSGHAGIDMWIGQAYARCQMDRVLQLVSYLSPEGVHSLRDPLPVWAMHLLWFLGHAAPSMVLLGDFGWKARLSKVLSNCRGDFLSLIHI